MRLDRFLSDPELRAAAQADSPLIDATEAAGEVRIDRRRFLLSTAAGSLMLGLAPLARAASEQTDKPQIWGAAPPPKALPPGPFISIGADDSVTVQVNRLDFGQGVQTALPMLIAEELDCDWRKIKPELAPAGDAYKDPVFGIQMVGGSNSIKNSWLHYRTLGATARALLVNAAAQRWKLDVASLRTADGAVIAPDGKRLRYGELAESAAGIALPETVMLKKPEQFRLLGKPTRRLDATAKSSGRQSYGIDRQLPGLKVAVVAHPPVFGAKVASVDDAKAKAVKGVRAVLRIPADRGGEAIAVVADGYWPAKQAREALDIKWDTSAVEKPDSAALLASYRERAKQKGTVAMAADMGPLTAPLGAGDRAGAAAGGMTTVAGTARATTVTGAPSTAAVTEPLGATAKVIEAEYVFPYLAHAPMEPLNCTIALKDGSAEVWCGSQFQTVDQNAIAKTLDLEPAKVKFNTEMAGGGFGRRAVPSSDYVVEAARIARAWAADGHAEPVKMIWSREDDIRGGYYRPMHVHRARIAVDAGGRVLAWEHRIVGQSIVKGTLFEGFLFKNGIDGTMVEGMGAPYAVPMELSVHNMDVNVPVLWWRSVGSTHTAYVMETLVDELAANAGADPVEYRRKLIGPNHPRHLAALDLAVQKSGYGKRRLPAGHAWGVALHESFNSVVAYVVEASVADGKPKLHHVWGGVHCNFAVNPLTVQAQVEGAALMALGTTLPGAAITLKDGAVEQTNFHQYTVARMPDMPVVEVFIVPSVDAPTGMGEPGLPALAPALANAVAKLTGKRLRSLPFEMQSAA
ncbi:xanthine dehydrogenase family protein molybdopterin-binding subunit [Derxia gummosa]|uniref:Xanthine dehydrogenase family protein molybdopterin-binding subunit n=1 Tax=Derxia gummosa DSM 723 TaxID=1121388 RepID=A0A9U5GRI4_9BURK|nr:xanthine dehydrogenase family protein molybdopterin-binding subunit [Derxia gummosa]